MTSVDKEVAFFPTEDVTGLQIQKEIVVQRSRSDNSRKLGNGIVNKVHFSMLKYKISSKDRSFWLVHVNR